MNPRFLTFSRMPFHFRTAGALLVVVALAACQAAVKKAEPEPEPEPQPSAAELLQGTWQSQDDWYEGEEQLGVRYTTLTFTKSRYIVHNAEVYDNGQLANDGSTFGEWSASDTEEVIRMGWYDTSPIVEGEVENLPGVLMRFSVQYFWRNDERTSIFLQNWNRARPESDYRSYTKVTDPMINIQGVWNHHDPDHEDLTLTIDGDSLLWQHHKGPDMSYDFHGLITGTDAEELFINVEVLKENDDGDLVESGEMARFAYVPTYKSDAVLFSVHWEESHEEDGRYTTPNPRHPHGGYWRLMLRE